MNYDFHTLVIGSWPGGLTVAIWLAKAGKKVALIEKEYIWWDCTNFWCVPSKAFLDISSKNVLSDVVKILDEVRLRREHIRWEETPELLETYGIHFFSWEASFISEHKVVIDSKIELSSQYIVIATGSSPQIVDIPWLQHQYILTNKNVFDTDLQDIKSIAIIGGWYIGCELAEAFNRSWV